jgi:hypothetical protein
MKKLNLAILNITFAQISGDLTSCNLFLQNKSSLLVDLSARGLIFCIRFVNDILLLRPFSYGSENSSNLLFKAYLTNEYQRGNSLKKDFYCSCFFSFMGSKIDYLYECEVALCRLQLSKSV